MFDGGKNRAISGRSAFAYAFVFLFAFQTFVASALMARTSSANASGIDAQIEGFFDLSGPVRQFLEVANSPAVNCPSATPPAIARFAFCNMAARSRRRRRPASCASAAVARLILVLDIPQRDFRIAAFLEKGWASSWSAQAPPFNA